ncbi:envelope glycoprotein [Plecturocebus cupreus]
MPLVSGAIPRTSLLGSLVERAGSFGGDWAPSTPLGISYKHASAGCPTPSGQVACWQTTPTIGVSDGGGPHDQIKSHHLKESLRTLFPTLSYHPLSLPKSRRLDLDSSTQSLLKAVHSFLLHGNSSTALFALPGQSFVCGNNLAFSYLPQNWTGICMVASLFPDASIVPGDNPFRFSNRKEKEGNPVYPFVSHPWHHGCGLYGTAGLGYSLQTYQQLSGRLTEPPGLDLLTAEKEAYALNEQCCFYANRSGIVRDKIKTLQEDLAKRRKALQDNPCGAGLMDFSPTSFLSLGLRFQELTRVTIHQMMLQPMPNLDRPEYRYTPLQTA